MTTSRSAYKHSLATLTRHSLQLLPGIVERLCLFEGYLALSFQFGKNLHGRLILSAGFSSLKGVGGVKISARDAKNCQPGCRQSLLTRIALDNRFPQHFSLAETTQGIIALRRCGDEDRFAFNETVTEASDQEPGPWFAACGPLARDSCSSAPGDAAPPQPAALTCPALLDPHCSNPRAVELLRVGKIEPSGVFVPT